MNQAVNKSMVLREKNWERRERILGQVEVELRTLPKGMTGSTQGREEVSGLKEGGESLLKNGRPGPENPFRSSAKLGPTGNIYGWFSKSAAKKIRACS